MPINKTKRENGYGEKLQVKVVTVDKEKRRVECATRDGAMIWAAVWETETIFRWPAVGETWTVRKDTGIWRMDALVQTPTAEIENEHVPTTLKELPEGATRILGEQVHMGSVLPVDITASGQITATDQSLTTHVDITPRVPLTAFSSNATEIWSDKSEYLSFDGVVPQPGQRVLLKEQTSEINGIYEVVYFENSRYTFGNPGYLSEMPITSTMQESVVMYPGWRTMPTIATGTVSGSGWRPTSYPTVAGLQYMTPTVPSAAGTITQVQIPSNPWPGEGRYVAVWSNMPDNGTRTGYRATLVTTPTTSVYNIFLQRILNGAIGPGPNNEISIAGVPFALPFTFSMVSGAQGVSLYRNNEGIMLLGDDTYFEVTGMSGIEGTGSNSSFVNFKTGPVPGGSYGSAAYAKWRLKRADDEIRTGQKIIVSSGGARKNTEYPVTASTETATSFEEWHSPIFNGSNQNYETNGAFDMVQYRKLPDGMVVLKGLIKSGAFIPNTMFTLPVGYRPARNLIFLAHAVYNSGGNVVGAFRVDVGSDGSVVNTIASGSELLYMSLSGISFYADGN